MTEANNMLSKRECMIIAPAGFGKTHMIAYWTKLAAFNGTELILTHTHAGVASLKEKLRKLNVAHCDYSVETISGFAQKYVLAFCTDEILSQNDSKYFPFVVQKATEICRLRPVQSVLSNSYAGIFIDEYQDCTTDQHTFITVLSRCFPTRYFGDPLQGIFDFNGQNLVDLNSLRNSSRFSGHVHELLMPQRWLNGNNKRLGEDLVKIREKLLENQSISFKDYPSIEYYQSSDVSQSHYKFVLELLIKESSLLVIDPLSATVHSRLSFIRKFKNIPRMLESIDDKEFYLLAQLADDITNLNVFQSLQKIMFLLFNKTGVDNWFNNKGCKRKTGHKEIIALKPVEDTLNSLLREYSFDSFATLLCQIKSLPEIKCYRKEIFSSLCKALQTAELNSRTVLDSMTEQRNVIRRMGRKIYGVCVGTTLLTKGLEFDTVVIVNAHRFDCRKNFYVAVTRASKRLIVFAERSDLNLKNLV